MGEFSGHCIVVSLSSSAVKTYGINSVLTRCPKGDHFSTETESGFYAGHWRLMDEAEVDVFIANQGKGHLLPAFHQDAIDAVCDGISDDLRDFQISESLSMAC